jgi:tRNA/rRNA methyltransferase
MAAIMSTGIVLDNVAIVLNRPRYPENIGAAARAMCNMGLKHLLVVNPKNFDLIKILKMATHASAHVVKQIRVFENLEDAIAPFHYIVGASARLGKHRLPAGRPERVAQKLVPISKKNRIAVLFGPEDTGLLNEDVRYCSELITIPTDEFSSLNLAQAVMIVCYEMFKAGNHANEKFVPRFASRHELEGMYDQLKDVLIRISFINPENPDYWMNNLRRFFDRIPLRAKEVKIIRGICRQIDWYGKKCRRDGSEAEES